MPSFDPHDPRLYPLIRGVARPDPTRSDVIGDRPAEPLADTEVDRWFAIFADHNRTPARWACLAAAIGHADIMTEGRSGATAVVGGPFVRGGPQWCHLAATTFEMLDRSGAYAHLAAAPTGRCEVNPDQIRAWLGAPVRYADETTTTVADTLDLGVGGEYLNVYHALEALIGAAQDVGVFGVAGYRVEVLHVVDCDLNPAGHHLLAHPTHGPAIASRLLYTDDLVDRDVAGIDAGIATLAYAANEINNTLDAHAANLRAGDHDFVDLSERSDVESIFVGSRARAFPPLHGNRVPAGIRVDHPPSSAPRGGGAHR